MREFEYREMFSLKCPICGCKNKVHTELLDKENNFIGYSLKCCACGNYHDFLLDYKNNGKLQYPHHKGIQRCIQPSFCPHKDCELYGTCNPKDQTNKPIRPNLDGNAGSSMTLKDQDKICVEVHNSPKFL